MPTIVCRVCGKSKQCKTRYGKVAEACSGRCRAQLLIERNGPDYFRRLSLQGSVAFKKMMRARRASAWELKYPGVPYETGQLVRKDGYHAGYMAAQERAYARAHAKAYEAGYQQGRAEEKQRRRAQLMCGGK